MDRDRWVQIKNHVQQLIKLPKARRKAWLKDQCANDPLLYKQVVKAYRAEQEKTTLAKGQADEGRAPMMGDLAGWIIGQWRLLRELGSGGMGSVWLAERANSDFKMLAAVKLIKRERADQEQVSRFKRERQILADLKHPNIATLLDGGSTPEGLPYLVMEYVEGSNIARYCLGSHMPTRERLRPFRDICKAVAHAHHRGVLHRDIKPSNIMVTKDGVAKLLDFGIAGFGDPSVTQTNLTMGGIAPMTPDYASPERREGRKATEADDIYALGLVLFYILTGKPPKSVGGNWEVVLRSAMTQHPDDTTLAACGELITQLLGKPQWRLTTADSLLTELEEIWTAPTDLQHDIGPFAELELTLSDDLPIEEGGDTVTMPGVTLHDADDEEDLYQALKKIMSEAGRLWKFGVAELALEKLMEALKLSPGNVEVHKRLKMVHLRMGNTAAAVESMEFLVNSAIDIGNYQEATDFLLEVQTHDPKLAVSLKTKIDKAAQKAGFDEPPTPGEFELDFGVTGSVDDTLDGFNLSMGTTDMEVLDMREVHDYETHTQQLRKPTFSGEWSLDWKMGADAPVGKPGEEPPQQDLQDIDQFIEDGSLELARGLIEAVRSVYGTHPSLEERATKLPPKK